MAGNKTQELASMAFDALPQAVLIVDTGGGIILRNSAAEAMLPAGDKISEVLKSGTEAQIIWDEELASLGRATGDLTHRNVSATGKGNRELLVDLHLHLLGGKGQNAAVVVIEDVSSRASMERRLAAGERLASVGELAGKVAHELNNPLDGVLRYIGLAERACSPGAAEYLTKARLGLNRMAGIIRDLTGEAGGLADRRQSADKLLDEAIAVMNPLAQAAGVSVVCDVSDSAEADIAGSVFQVFCNVIKNALDAMPDGGALTIRLRCDGGQCVADFSDTGCGISDEQAEAIFQPFYTTKPSGKGVGLGLSICREILTRLGGTISARNRPEGGAIITVRVPLRKNGENIAEKK